MVIEFGSNETILSSFDAAKRPCGLAIQIIGLICEEAIERMQSTDQKPKAPQVVGAASAV